MLFGRSDEADPTYSLLLLKLLLLNCVAFTVKPKLISFSGAVHTMNTMKHEEEQSTAHWTDAPLSGRLSQLSLIVTQLCDTYVSHTHWW